MKYIDTSANLEPRIQRGVEQRAVPLFRDELRTSVPRATGEFANTLVVSFSKEPGRSRVKVASPLRRGFALEIGANVGARRGPHMRGQHRIERTMRDRWGGVVSQALREEFR